MIAGRQLGGMDILCYRGGSKLVLILAARNLYP
jgi:hypothetical protein